MQIQGFLTCSIAIFQWRPKASGRGLKKVNACRVCGYMLDRNNVYLKPQEICDRLNAENADVATPPKWLQKQYSVPRRKLSWCRAFRTDISAGTVRSIRKRVVQRVLIPAGFLDGTHGTYVRQIGDQIHLINFQASKYGHEYTVNLGLHYSFLSPLLNRGRRKLADYSQVDCGLSTRIGEFKDSTHDTWFKYGVDRGA